MQGTPPCKTSRLLCGVRRKLKNHEEGSPEHDALAKLRDTYVETLSQGRRDRVVARVNAHTAAESVRVNAHTTAESGRVLAAVGAVGTTVNEIAPIVLDIGAAIDGMEGRLMAAMRPKRQRRSSPGSSAAAVSSGDVAADATGSSGDVADAAEVPGSQGSKCPVQIPDAKKKDADGTPFTVKGRRCDRPQTLQPSGEYACRYHCNYRHAAKRSRQTVALLEPAAPAAPVTRQLTMEEEVDRLFDKSQPAAPAAEQTAVEPPFDPRPADRPSSATLRF